MHYFIDVLKKYAVFSGRARRAEYWYFYLFNLLISIAFVILGSIITFITGNLSTILLVYILFWVYSLAILLPGLGVAVRRLHDTGKSGWMIFIILIPFAGAIWFLVLMCTDSDSGDNEYGPNPKGQQTTTSIPPTPPPQPQQPVNI